MKKLTILFFAVLLNTAAFNQDSHIDSLLKLSSENLYKNTDTAIYYAKKAIELSYEEDYLKGKISGFGQLANAYFMNNQYWVAEDAYKEALQIAKEYKDTIQIAICMANLGNIYNTTKEYELALEMYNEANKTFLLRKDSLSLTRTLHNIGLIYQDQKMYDKALEYYTLTLDIKNKLKGTSELAPTLANIGEVLHELKNTTEAVKHLKEAIRLFEKAGHTQRVLTTRTMLAHVYFDMGNVAEAHRLVRGFEMDESVITSIEFKYNAHEILSKIYKKERNYKLALNHYEKFKLFQDSIHTYEKLESQELYKSKLLNEKNKAEIGTLKSTQSDNEAYQSQLELNVAQADYGQMLMVGLVLILGLISISIFIILYQRNGNLKRKLTYNELKSGIVQVVSHEFRTPLAGIMSSSELLRPSVKEEDEIKFLDRIDKSSEQMLEILSSFTEQSANKEDKFTMKMFSIQETTKDIVENVVPNNEIEYHFVTESDEMYLSKTIYTVILRNLLTNAVKYGKENGVIIVSVTQKHKSQIQIEVKDFGNGIPKKYLKNIFEKGNRADLFDNKGDGMGLFIVRSYLGLIGGTIKVYSKQNQGTTFTVMMPVQTSE